MPRYLQNARKVTPYTPGEQPRTQGLIKLNTNECPYPPSPAVGEALSRLQAGDMRLYPDPMCRELCQAIAGVYHVDESQVFVGVGSDDVLAMIFETFFTARAPIFFPDITYAFYPVWCNLFQIPFETKPLREDFTIDPADYEGAPGGIVFPNPNAPTGVELSQDAIEQILRQNPEVLVVVDEAYVDFGAKSALPLLEKYPNLLVVQTFSKSRALAGMRIGFCIGERRVIQALLDVKFSFNSYTLSRAAIEIGARAVADEAYFRKTTLKIAETREQAKARFAALGFHCPDSKSNFLFVTHPRFDAAKLFLALRRGGILVRHFDAPRVRDYLRVTIGTDAQMDALFRFLERYLRE